MQNGPLSATGHVAAVARVALNPISAKAIVTAEIHVFMFLITALLPAPQLWARSKPTCWSSSSFIPSRLNPPCFGEKRSCSCVNAAKVYNSSVYDEVSSATIFCNSLSLIDEFVALSRWLSSRLIFAASHKRGGY